jgi:hypothetical protein
MPDAKDISRFRDSVREVVGYIETHAQETLAPDAQERLAQVLAEANEYWDIEDDGGRQFLLAWNTPYNSSAETGDGRSAKGYTYLNINLEHLPWQPYEEVS